MLEVMLLSPVGARSHSTFNPRLAPWALLFAPLRGSKILPQRLAELSQRPFIPPIPHPKPKLLSLHQSRLGQNRHMMRNGRLGQVNALLDVRSAQAHILANRTSALFLEGLQDPPPGRIGHRVEDTVDFSFCHESSNKSRIDRCQYGTPGVRPRTSDQARK